MKYLPNYKNFLSEAGRSTLDIERLFHKARLSKWEEIDEDEIEEYSDHEVHLAEELYGWKCQDKNSGNEYRAIIVAFSNYYYFQLEEDENVIWEDTYKKSQKKYLDQDMKNILGFSI